MFVEIEEKGMRSKSILVIDDKSLERYEKLLEALDVNFSRRVEFLIKTDLENLIRVIEL